MTSVLNPSDSNKFIVSISLFNLHFPDDIGMEFFHVLICHLNIFISEVSVKAFDPFLIRLFLFILLNFKGYVYILDNSLYHQIVFGKSVASLSMPLTVYSTQGEIFNLNQFQHFFTNHAFYFYIYSAVKHTWSFRFSLMLFSTFKRCRLLNLGLLSILS